MIELSVENLYPADVLFYQISNSKTKKKIFSKTDAEINFCFFQNIDK